MACTLSICFALARSMMLVTNHTDNLCTKITHEQQHLPCALLPRAMLRNPILPTPYGPEGTHWTPVPPSPCLSPTRHTQTRDVCSARHAALRRQRSQMLLFYGCVSGWWLKALDVTYRKILTILIASWGLFQNTVTSSGWRTRRLSMSEEMGCCMSCLLPRGAS